MEPAARHEGKAPFAFIPENDLEAHRAWLLGSSSSRCL